MSTHDFDSLFDAIMNAAAKFDKEFENLFKQREARFKNAQSTYKKHRMQKNKLKNPFKKDTWEYYAFCFMYKDELYNRNSTEVEYPCSTCTNTFMAPQHGKKERVCLNCGEKTEFLSSTQYSFL